MTKQTESELLALAHRLAETQREHQEMIRALHLQSVRDQEIFVTITGAMDTLSNQIASLGERLRSLEPQLDLKP